MTDSMWRDAEKIDPPTDTQLLVFRGFYSDGTAILSVDMVVHGCGSPLFPDKELIYWMSGDDWEPPIFWTYAPEVPQI